MAAPRFVRCPQCGRPVEWSMASQWRPFCSARCKTIDLGAWASESYRMPVVEADDPEEMPPEGPAGGGSGRGS